MAASWSVLSVFSSGNPFYTMGTLVMTASGSVLSVLSSGNPFGMMGTLE